MIDKYLHPMIGNWWMIDKYIEMIIQARRLRALGLLMADGTPTMGGGKTF